jgi:hypothetical protein
MNRTRNSARTTRKILGLLLAKGQLMIAPALLPSTAFSIVPAANLALKASGMPISTPVQHAPVRCQATGAGEITIVCDYSAVAVNAEEAVSEPRIALNHAALSFKTKHDGWARVELAFTKLDAGPVPEPRMVYLAVDDDSGHNFIRRELPKVDFRSLVTGRRTAFSERLLLPAFQSGRYRIELWIPSSDPALRFNPNHNFLLSGFGLADKKTGLNRIATFSVVR